MFSRVDWTMVTKKFLAKRGKVNATPRFSSAPSQSLIKMTIKGFFSKGLSQRADEGNTVWGVGRLVEGDLAN